MQTPTPPTKPTPPTPPSMKTSNAVPSTDTHTPAKPTIQTSTPAKETPKVSATDQSQSTDAKNNIPPLGSYSNSAKETTSETKTPPAIPNQKNSPVTSGGMTIFLVLTMFITIGLVAVHWFKNNKPKQKPAINYTSESTDDLVELILSEKTTEPAPQMAAKSPPKKVLLKPATKPKNKGGFEVRV